MRTLEDVTNVSVLSDAVSNDVIGFVGFWCSVRAGFFDWLDPATGTVGFEPDCGASVS